ncbi:NuoM family protein [Vampirovibrio sp.]|uniref:complex I subunit 4 family protein n=1 Tax=Vampirovibrio sp. TaxID=2717857 RepID=UPI0035942E50
MNFITEHYLSILIFLPVLLILPILLAPEGKDGRNIHILGIGGAALLFVYSSLAWMGLVNPVAEVIPWIPSLGITYSLGTDGLTMTLVYLTTFLLLMSAIASFTSIHKRLKLYYSMLFVLTTAVLGVFLARDMFLFFLFWELELIPMYLLIAIWGGPRRDYASVKFVLYTLFGSVFLVAGTLALYLHARSLPGADMTTLFQFQSIQNAIGQNLPLTAQVLIFIALFTTFAVKLPVVPVHTWLPDAHVEAPTPISMMLAGILLKMGAYGMLRFGFEFLPDAARVLAPYIAVLAVINIVYTAGVALVQTDLKKLIAYSSVSHMGFVLLGLAALNAIGFNGAVFVMFAHGLVSAALFMCVGTLYNRTHTRAIADYGGFGTQTPVIFYFFLFMSMASLGLPLLVSFASETLVFYGAFVSKAFQTIPFFGSQIELSIQGLTFIAGLGVVIGAAYLLWMLKRVFFGPIQARWTSLPDATSSEVFVLLTLTLLVMAFGLYPSLITSEFEPDVTAIADKHYADLNAQNVALQKPTLKSLLSTHSTGAKQ